MLKGHLLDERYEIERTIGGGGMANVYLAKDTILNREVAIKVLRLEYANDDEFIQRFHREAQSATSLSHPNIVNIYDVGEEENILYMAMEYVDGMTLKEYIQAYGPIEVEQSLEIMKQLSSAIAHAHANDIVHRDIKPQNILMDTYGNVKVTDFGIAVALSATALTQTNSVLGSVHYLSPEQARGGMATKKSDIYSLGIVLYELLTGQLPFSGQSAVSIALKHLQTETPSVRMFDSSIPQSVENIVLQATAKDPFHRYETVFDLEVALDTALNPDKINEEKFEPPEEEGEETKAVPIVTGEKNDSSEQEETLVHAGGQDTKPYKGNKKGKKSKKKKKQKGKKKKKWLIISIIILVLLLSGIAALFIIPGILQPKTTSVPDVVEWEYDEAVEELESINLEADKEERYSEDIDEGLIIKSDPKADRTVKEGSTITLYVSQGKEEVEFDDYVGKDYSQVERMLEEKGYEVLSIDKFSDAEEGEITKQIEPNPGKEVVPSETKVIFEVSKGPEMISLINLKGMSEDAAKEYLDEKGLEMNLKEEHSDSIPEGEVARQDPEANTDLKEGDTVDVYLSNGPEELPPASKTVEVTVPYNPDEPADDHNDDKDNDSEKNDDDQKDDEDNDDNQNNEENKKEQTVKIYIEDMNNDLEDIYQEDTITEDTDYEFTLTIEADQKAEYKIVRDDEVIKNKTVSYEEGE